jgi:hypothetical protein
VSAGGPGRDFWSTGRALRRAVVDGDETAEQLEALSALLLTLEEFLWSDRSGDQFDAAAWRSHLHDDYQAALWATPMSMVDAANAR